MRSKTAVTIGASVTALAIAAGAALYSIRSQEPQVRAFRAVIDATLYDPLSAQYREDALFQNADGLVYYCGRVNAKNALGGYVGFRRFVAGRASAVLEQAEQSPAFDRYYAQNCAIRR